MSQSFTNFSSLTESLSVYPGRCFIAGDLNIHFDKADDHDTQRMFDILSSAGLRQHMSLHVIIVLLDLSAAFNTIDHQVLLQRLQDHFSITGTAFRWMTSYFHRCEQCIIINGVQSDWKHVHCGAPQGSVFGPMAFSYYSAPIKEIIKAHDLECMIYADDTQIYFCFNDNEMSVAISRIEKCIADIRSWMVTNKLKLNDNKTEILHLTLRFIPQLMMLHLFALM